MLHGSIIVKTMVRKTLLLAGSCAKMSFAALSVELKTYNTEAGTDSGLPSPFHFLLPTVGNFHS